MEIIDATEATHRANMFWYDNKERTYEEKIMFAIANAAEGGKNQIEWKFFLPKNIQTWLYNLGYSIQQIECDFNIKRFRYFIEWKKFL